jgi:hypothetical protein
MTRPSRLVSGTRLLVLGESKGIVRAVGGRHRAVLGVVGDISSKSRPIRTLDEESEGLWCSGLGLKGCC